MSISSYYDGSFNSVGFMELFDGGMSGDDYPVDTEITIVHYPGGNNNAVKSGGKKAKILELPIVADGSDVTSLEGLVNSSHSLVYRRGTVTAFLQKVSARKKMKQQDIHRAVLTFVVS